MEFNGLLFTLLIAVSATKQQPPLPGGAFASDMPNDEKCRDNENVFDCIIRMNQINSRTDSYSQDIKPQLFEGDIVWTNKLKSQIGEMKVRSQSGMAVFDAIRNGAWPKQGNSAIIPYTFASGFSYQKVVRDAIAEYNKYTCVRFVPYTSTNAKAAGGYIEFMHGGGCYSMIGRQRGKQQVSLGRGCNYKGTAIHEMMHALGWFHEQSRRDRDQYITINWNNINRQMWYNFEMYRSGQADTLGEPYDKKSVMHYGNYAFSINGQKTIVSKSNANERFGGQFVGLSVIDRNQLNKYYKCNKGPGPTTKPTTKNCNDQYSFCKVLKSYCSNTWVTSNCKKTCNLCKTPVVKKTCRDKNGNCEYWSGRGFCTQGSYIRYMKGNCKKSCKQYCV